MNPFPGKTTAPGHRKSRSARAESVCYFWNMFDQVLVRPSLLDAFANDHLKILDSNDDDSLLTARGLPNKAAASDHLPIVFGLEL